MLTRWQKGNTKDESAYTTRADKVVEHVLREEGRELRLRHCARHLPALLEDFAHVEDSLAWVRHQPRVLVNAADEMASAPQRDVVAQAPRLRRQCPEEPRRAECSAILRDRAKGLERRRDPCARCQCARGLGGSVQPFADVGVSLDNAVCLILGLRLSTGLCDADAGLLGGVESNGLVDLSDAVAVSWEYNLEKHKPMK